jgi:dihydropteroate synthase
MGILNITPDSFSGDGTLDPATAAARAAAMEAAGADIIDVGAESSRPGAGEVPPEREAARLLPALRAVRAATRLPISVDTYHAPVAEAALDAGADMINDIHGLRRDPGLGGLAGRLQAPVVAMHNQRGRPVTDVITDIGAGFDATLEVLRNAGGACAGLILDPGFGFGWTPAQNLEIVRRLPELWRFQLPLLVGVSRKSTIGHVLAQPNPAQRQFGTAALCALAIAGGADLIRVHDVAEMVQVARMTDTVVRPFEPGSNR